MEDSLNSYLEEITAYLKDNSLLISALKSSVALFTPDTHQAKTHPRILIEDSRLPLVKCPKILGVHMDTSHDVKHLFNCPAHPTTMTPSDLWNRPVDEIRELGYLEAGILDNNNIPSQPTTSNDIFLNLSECGNSSNISMYFIFS